jgi:hypothetical protein
VLILFNSARTVARGEKSDLIDMRNMISRAHP